MSGNLKDEEIFIRYKGNWGGDSPSRGEVCAKSDGRRDRLLVHRNNWGNEDRLKKSKVQMTLTDGWGKQPKDLKTE